MSDDRPAEATGGQSKISQGVGIITSVKPGLYIVKFWQGIVDIVVHGVVAVLALITFAAGASFSADILVSTESLKSSAGGWLAFIGFIVMLIELTVIVLRFINFAFVTDYPLMVMIVNAVYCGVTLAGVFAGFIAVAVYSNEYSNLASLSTGTAAQFYTTAATKGVILAIFTFFFIAALVAELVYAILWFALGWYKRLLSTYNVSSEP